MFEKIDLFIYLCYFFKYMKRLFFFIILIFFQLFYFEAQAKNVVYIVVEGVSRDTLYSLINKNKLPNYQKIISRGNYRNLSIENSELKNNESTFLLYNGVLSSEYISTSFFEYLAEAQPSLNIKCFLSTPISKEYNINTEASLIQHIELTGSNPLQYLRSIDIGNSVANFISKNTDEFFFMINFTNVDYVGWRYREGAVLYSQALLNTDRAIGKIIDALEDKNLFEETEFLITTNYGYHMKTQLRKAEGWVVSSRKALRKGNLNDIYPSLVDLLDLKNTIDFPLFEGKTLFEPIQNPLAIEVR